MTQQHKPGTTTGNKSKPDVRGVNTATALILDLGPENQDQTCFVSSEQDFWNKFPYSVTIGDTTVPIDADTRPLPLVIAKRLAEQPGSVIRQLDEAAAWIDGASDQEIMQLARLLSHS